MPGTTQLVTAAAVESTVGTTAVGTKISGMVPEAAGAAEYLVSFAHDEERSDAPSQVQVASRALGVPITW